MLKIIINNTTSPEFDASLYLDNYVNGSYSTVVSAPTTIDIGYYKPINALYFEFIQSLPAGTLEVYYFNGTTLAPLAINDKTFKFSRPGFVTWDRNTLVKKSTLLGEEAYYYRFVVSNYATVTLILKAINLVFSDDTDLLESYPDIMEYLPENATSFISYHQSSRNSILTYLRNKGKSVTNLGVRKMLDQFDLHQYEEVRQASKYKTLASIFYNESDNVDDKWYQKAKDFDRMYGESINLNFLSIDENDDGKEEDFEKQSIQYLKIQRL